MSLFVLVSNSSSYAFQPNKRKLKQKRSKQNITTIITPRTSESTDSVILALVTASFNPCDAGIELKPQEQEAYGCQASNFSIAQLYKADCINVSTQDYHLVSLLAVAFLQTPNEHRRLNIFVPASSPIKIHSMALGKRIHDARNRIRFIAQTTDNARAILSMTAADYARQTRAGTLTHKKTAYAFPIIERLTSSGTKTMSNAIIIDADEEENVAAFLSIMQISQSSSQSYHDGP